MRTTLTALGSALLFTALLSVGAVAQEAPPRSDVEDGPGEHCSTHDEIKELMSDGVVSGEPNEGYHGILYGGEVVLEDGTAGWAADPEVQHVYCGSPADSAGIVPGDTIVRVNGEDARKPRVLTPWEAGMIFRLQILRDGEILPFTITTVERPPEAWSP